MDNEDKFIAILRASEQKLNLEEIRKKFWRIDKTFKTTEDYYDANQWIPAGSPGWASSLERTGGKDRQRFKSSEQGKEDLNIPVPNASALMLNAARKDYGRARLLNEEQIKAKAAGSNELEVSGIIFDMLEEDMESIIMAYAAIEAFVNETVQPEDKIYIARKGNIIVTPLSYEEFTRMTLEEKLDQVLPKKLGTQPIDKDGKDNIWRDYKELENLRHDIIHMRGEKRQSNVTEEQSIWIWGRIYEAGVRWKTPAYVRALKVIKYFSRSHSGEYPNWIVNFPQT